jgi:4,5:9,10-diseco-3-hydroxy-5,9,17-trioxoandrosta-1(10),2-diene-4-oate hydrolase
VSAPAPDSPLPAADSRLYGVDGAALFVDRRGTGPPVLCLPAIGHDALDFDPLAHLLGDRFEFIRVEWPGQGRSPRESRPASAGRYAQLLAGLVPQLEIEAPIVIGNSIGGAAGILHASRHRVRALVLCNSGGLIAASASVRRFCRLFEAFFAAGERGAFWYPGVFSLYYRLVLSGKAARSQRARIVERCRALAPVLREAWASFAQPDADLRDVVTRLDVPIFIAWAQGDRLIPLARCRPTIERLAGARISLFDARHTPFLEQAEAFAHEFASFAAALPART